MSNFSLDIIGKALPKIVHKSETSAPVDDFLQKILFKQTVMGTQGTDGFEVDLRKYSPHVAAEAIRGTDPTRMNYKSEFKANYFVPNYYHDMDEVALEDADVRAFGEDVTVDVATGARVTKKFAEKRDAMHDSYTLAKEKMCADTLLTGYVTNKNGQQPSLMTSSLLSLSGANLWSDFLGTISTAYNNVRKKNKNFRPNALIMNPTYATLCVKALNTAGLLNKEGLNLAIADFKAMANGAVPFGTVNTPAGVLTIIGYYGNDGSNDYITDQKAILCNLDMGIGAMGYGRVQAYVPGVGKTYVVEQERVTPCEVGEGGDMRSYAIEMQSAPIPVITNVDGYGVLTSIPSSVA